MNIESLRIATRSSQLALWQANYVKQAIQAIHPHVVIELLELKTQGDKILDQPLAKIGGKGLFVKELELALQDGRADLAVHSMKDMPAEQPRGLTMPVICQRGSPWDAFVANDYQQLAQLPANARIGTSSLRRQAQLKVLRPDLQYLNLRGNVNTRLHKLDTDHYDAIILAAAGLIRLDFKPRIQQCFSSDELLPAAGQGAIGVQCRQNAEDIIKLLAPLHHTATAACVQAERALTRCLEGSCQAPIASYAELIDHKIVLRGKVLSPDGQHIIAANSSAPLGQAQQLGHKLGTELLNKGAKAILDELLT